MAVEVLSWGATRERTVGILAPPSFEFVASLIGVWKAGAIAVPLQPQHPEAELAYIVADSQITDILAHDACSGLARKLGVRARFLSRSKGAPPASNPAANDGALIIYTSGTTSRPKGVVTTYHGLDAQVRSQIGRAHV